MAWRSPCPAARLLDDLVILLAGRAAEGVVFAADLVSGGAAADCAQAIRLCREMAGRLGMFAELGPVSYPDGTPGHGFGRRPAAQPGRAPWLTAPGGRGIAEGGHTIQGRPPMSQRPQSEVDARILREHDDLGMPKSPHLWPRPGRISGKRWSGRGGPECGVLDIVAGGYRVRPPGETAAPGTVYATAEAAVADGWLVD